MKKTKKIVALVLAAVMLVCTTVAATVAYLTAGTEYVKNTFTVGNVQIDLDEEMVDQYGDTVNSGRTNSNSYTLVPGHEYLKDPTVYVKKPSQPCWVFVKVVNGLADVEAAGNNQTLKEDNTYYKTIAEQMTANGWIPLDGVIDVYYYEEIIDAREEEVSRVVFGEFMIADNADFVDESNSNADRFADVTIDAYAVQADGFETAALAWAAAEGQWEN